MFHQEKLCNIMLCDTSRNTVDQEVFDFFIDYFGVSIAGHKEFNKKIEPRKLSVISVHRLMKLFLYSLWNVVGIIGTMSINIKKRHHEQINIQKPNATKSTKA